MTVDSQLRDELHRAVGGLELREEIALQFVKATRLTEWPDVTVVALEHRESPRPQHVKARRIVGALAACALLAGAVALPVALRNPPRAPAARVAGQPGTTGYQSTVTVRIGVAPSRPSTPTTQPLGIRSQDPVLLALASGTRNTALRRSHLPSNDPDIDFKATTDAAGDVLLLTVITPTAIGTTTLARNWAAVIGDARSATAQVQIRALQHNLALGLTRLHRELQRVDRQLVKLAPATYKNLLRYDGGNSGLGGPAPPPPVPEPATPQVLDLAFERIQILSSLTQSGKRATQSRVAATAPAFAQLISQTPAVLITSPHSHSNSSSTLIAIGLLLGGLILATSAFLLGRRSRGLGLRRSRAR